MNATRTLADLYAELPKVNCIPGCRDCCSPPTMATAEEAREFAPINLVEMLAAGKGENYVSPMDRVGFCAKVHDAGCSIHDKRPFLCRIFGTVDAKEVPYNAGVATHLICPHGRKPDAPLTWIQANSLMREYFEIARHAKP
jgi:hypothetical protein